MTSCGAALSRLLIAASLLAGSLGHTLAQPAPPREKVDYVAIAPQPVATAERIEVVEFFWYGCPHCYNLQPALDAWIKRKPADVVLRRIPAAFRDSWLPHARIYYTLEALGETERLHHSVYTALHQNKESLMTANQTVDWAARNGIQPAQWLTAYNSPEVTRKVEASKDLTKAYAVPGTPSLVVDGRYLTSSGMAESMSALIQTLEGLIVMGRDRRSGR